MPYIGRGPQQSGAFRILDDISLTSHSSGGFNGTRTTFALTVGNAALTVGLPETLTIAIDGVVQEPGTAYTISGSNIVFAAAPQTEATFWGVELGDVGGLADRATTQAANDNTTKVATTAYVQTELGDYAPLAAPTFTGNAAAVTQAGTDDSTRIATTAHVKDVKIDDFAAGDDNTDLDSNTNRHGLLRKLDGTATNFLNGAGNWAAAGGARTVAGTTDNGIVTFVSSGSTFTAESELKYNGAGNLHYSRAGTVQFDMVPTGGSSQAWALSARTDGTFRITNDTDGSIDINLTGDGEITTARQPCFQTKLDSSRNNVTGGGQSWQFGDTDNITDRFDVGSNVSSTGIFTAPVTGKYLLHAHLTIVNSGMDSAHDNYLLTVWTSNRSYDTFAGLYAMRAATGNIGATSVKDSVIADMDAGDTAKLLFYVYDGSQTIDINEGNNSYFSGYLLG